MVPPVLDPHPFLRRALVPLLAAAVLFAWAPDAYG